MTMIACAKCTKCKSFKLKLSEYKKHTFSCSMTDNEVANEIFSLVIGLDTEASPLASDIAKVPEENPLDAKNARERKEITDLTERVCELELAVKK